MRVAGWHYGCRRGCLPEHARVVTELTAALGPDEYGRLHSHGARLSLDEAVAVGFAEPSNDDHAVTGGVATAADPTGL